MDFISHTSVKRGVFFMLLGMLIFSLLNAIIKETTTHYSPIQLVFFRCFFAAFPAAIFLVIRRQWVQPSPFEWKIHLKRAFLLSFGLSILFLGVGMLPLSNSTTLYFSATFFLIILSYPILREKIDLIQGVAVAIGFVGVLIVVEPGKDVFHWGALFVVMGALMESAYNLYGRLLSSSHNSFMLTFLGSLLPSLLVILVLPFFWVTPDLGGWIALILLGLGGGLGQLCLTCSYYYAPAGIVAPMMYSALLWSVLLDIGLYGNWPTRSLFLGCGIIIISGFMIIFYRSRNRVQEETLSS